MMHQAIYEDGSSVTLDDFVDFWSRIAQIYADNDLVYFNILDSVRACGCFCVTELPVRGEFFRCRIESINNQDVSVFDLPAYSSAVLSQ